MKKRFKHTVVSIFIILLLVIGILPVSAGPSTGLVYPASASGKIEIIDSTQIAGWAWSNQFPSNYLLIQLRIYKAGFSEPIHVSEAMTAEWSLSILPNPPAIGGIMPVYSKHFH